MEIEYTQQAQDDLKFWPKSGNKSVQNRIVKLLDAILENPYEGIGKPEASKYELTGKWSR